MAGSNGGNDGRPTTEDFADTITRVLSHAVNEPVLLQKMEQYFKPRPANIFSNDDEREELIRRIDGFQDRFGRKFVIVVKGEPPPQLRTYHIDISNELGDSFHACRSAVCRLHMFYMALKCIRTRPEFWVDLSEDGSRLYARTLTRSFWDALEIATIRVASYWDRVGQLLDFVFFNIRQYEHDGFPAVLERIKKNAVTFFPDERARTKNEEVVPIDVLATCIFATVRRVKRATSLVERRPFWRSTHGQRRSQAQR